MTGVSATSSLLNTSATAAGDTPSSGGLEAQIAKLQAQKADLEQQLSEAHAAAGGKAGSGDSELVQEIEESLEGIAQQIAELTARKAAEAAKSGRAGSAAASEDRSQQTDSTKPYALRISTDLSILSETKD